MKTYIVQAGDSPWKVSLNLLGDGTKYKELLRANNLNENSVIHPGLKIIIPNILDNTPPRKKKLKSFEEITQFEKGINNKSDLDIINYYHKAKGDNKIYLVDDKLNGKLSVYKDGVLLKSYRAIHGKNKLSDDMTITKLDKNKKLINLGGNVSTPAGVYYSTRGADYHGAPSFMRRTKQQVESNNPHGIPSSIHARTITETANTNGCTGLSGDSLKDLSKYIKSPNVPTYILPVNPNNRFFIRNGELQFKSHDIAKTPAHNTIVSNPIKQIKYSTQGLNDTNLKVIKEFNQGLILYKNQLLKDLGINNDTYNELALGALGILGVETGYGNENSGFGNFLRIGKKAILKKLFNKDSSSADYKSEYSTYGINGDNNSVGLTLIRFNYLSDKEKSLFKKYGITKDDLVYNPKKAAVATMIKLALNFLDRGLNVDKAISGWNTKPSYLLQVKNNQKRFKLYEMYNTGGKIPFTMKFF